MCKDQPLASQKKGAGTAKRSRSRESQSSKTSRARRQDTLQKEMGASAQNRITNGGVQQCPLGSVFWAPGPSRWSRWTAWPTRRAGGRSFWSSTSRNATPETIRTAFPYQVAAEVCVPEIMYKDFSSIFEEHRMCKSSHLLHFCPHQDSDAQCGDVFEVTPARMCIPSHSHAFTMLTFCPPAIQTYSAMFEASLEGSPSLLQIVKCKALLFDVAGEGNLPCVSVVRPALRGPQGTPFLQFQRVLAGRAHTLPLGAEEQRNRACAGQVNIHLLDKMGVFTLRAGPNTACTSMDSSVLHSDAGEERQVAHTASLVLVPGQQAEFEAEFRPTSAQTFEASMDLLVVDNQYEETVVHLAGEGYCDIITFDNIGSRLPQEQDSVEDSRSDTLNFGDCHVSRPYHETFTLTNHSSSEVLRFEWPADVPQPLVLEARPVRCKVCRISFERPVDQVPDWDDRQRTVKWVDAGKQGSHTRTDQEEGDGDRP
ncbi:hypothetical protein SKAU_G00343370 [Synaphobranchus kaupii]|uniref:Uncharacterized protein n=1 Tax=Synaphobranchus kaupii TaxID=118154 RepID=A0A9Q1IHH0_SYNKA|nr:hypothetical protein SKAU_G00343370 [Synaphobranchus kaupii]